MWNRQSREVREVVRNMDISNLPTRDLVEELQRRNGVKTEIAEPYQDVEVKVSGPAIVLVVID